jgi:hypothetical protein
MSNKLKVFCNIAVYLEQEDPALFEVISRLCLLGNLNARGPDGVTFLHPRDALRDSIISDAYSKDNAGRAVNNLQACVVLGYIPSIGEFAHGFVNLLRRTVSCKVAGGKATCGNATISPSKFVALERRDKKPPNAIVYEITGEYGAESGEMKAREEAPAATAGRRRRVRGGAIGVYGGDMKNPMTARENLLDRSVGLFVSSAGRNYSPANVLINLVEYFDAKNQDVAKAIREQLDYCPLASLVIVLNCNPQIISDSDLEDAIAAYNKKPPTKRTLDDYIALVPVRPVDKKFVDEVQRPAAARITVTNYGDVFASVMGSTEAVIKLEARYILWCIARSITRSNGEVNPGVKSNLYHMIDNCLLKDKPYFLVGGAAGVDWFYSMMRLLIRSNKLRDQMDRGDSKVYNVSIKEIGDDPAKPGLIDIVGEQLADLRAQSSEEISGGADEVDVSNVL